MSNYVNTFATINIEKADIVFRANLTRQLLNEAKGSHAEAARLLGTHPKYLHRLIRNLNLKSDVKKLA
jgi:transcriptional regulator with GAF, ATPase, and Fis domain